MILISKILLPIEDDLRNWKCCPRTTLVTRVATVGFIMLFRHAHKTQWFNVSEITVCAQNKVGKNLRLMLAVCTKCVFHADQLTEHIFHQLFLSAACRQLFWANVCFELQWRAVTKRIQPFRHTWRLSVTYQKAVWRCSSVPSHFCFVAFAG